MKKTTCKEIGGVCGDEISGSSLRQMGENARNHIMAKIKSGDQVHKSLMEDIQQMGMGEKLERIQELKDKYEQLPELS
jgi:hypothetical protein